MRSRRLAIAYADARAQGGSRPRLVAMKVYVGQTRSPALIAKLERHGNGECVVRGELLARRPQFSYEKSPIMHSPSRSSSEPGE